MNSRIEQVAILFLISSILGENNLIVKYGISSFISSNLINNIPMSVLFSNIINISETTLQHQAIYSTIIGSNLGAFLTPVGALAGIILNAILPEDK